MKEMEAWRILLVEGNPHYFETDCGWALFQSSSVSSIMCDPVSVHYLCSSEMSSLSIGSACLVSCRFSPKKQYKSTKPLILGLESQIPATCGLDTFIQLCSWRRSWLFRRTIPLWEPAQAGDELAAQWLWKKGSWGKEGQQPPGLLPCAQQWWVTSGELDPLLDSPGQETYWTCINQSKPRERPQRLSRDWHICQWGEAKSPGTI